MAEAKLGIAASRDALRELEIDVYAEKVWWPHCTHGPQGVAATLERLGTEVDFGSIDMSNFAVLETSERTGAAAVLRWWTDRRHALVHQGGVIQVNMEQSLALIGFIEALADHVDTQALAALG